jgi:hypothetical protein
MSDRKQSMKNRKFSKYYKILKTTKLPSKKVLIHENRWKNSLFIANFSKIHKTAKKIFLAKTKKYVSHDIEW